MYDEEILWFILYFVAGAVALIIHICFSNFIGKKFGSLAGDKGYDYQSTKSFVSVMWFFSFGFIGLLYVVAMPNKNAGTPSNPVSDYSNQTAPIEEKVKIAEKRTYEKLNDGYKIVKFGSYPQGPNGEVLPIRWRVLFENNGFTKLVSVDALESRPFDYAQATSNWDSCSLRTFLNNDFYCKAFNASEQEAIILQQNVTSDFFGQNPYMTKEKVYLLSIQDVKNPAYSFDTISSKSITRWTKSSDYAKKQGIYVSKNNENCYWWLRNPGADGGKLSFISASGTVKGDYNRRSRNGADGGVRPAITVMSSALH